MNLEKRDLVLKRAVKSPRIKPFCVLSIISMCFIVSVLSFVTAYISCVRFVVKIFSTSQSFTLSRFIKSFLMRASIFCCVGETVNCASFCCFLSRVEHLVYLLCNKHLAGRNRGGLRLALADMNDLRSVHYHQSTIINF